MTKTETRSAHPRRCRGLALALGLLLLLAACADRHEDSDDNHRGGFYGGVSGGMTRVP